MDLRPLGENVRRLRQLRHLTLKELAMQAHLSPRFLSDLERGRGNISIARLLAVSQALQVPLSGLVAPLDEAQQASARPILALIGLRGAGKSTIGRAVANHLGRPFVELDVEVESDAGLPLDQVFEMHGEAYYRRLEQDALARVVTEHSGGCVLATGGGIVTEADSWRLLSAHCSTVWLQAKPEDHYQRVMAQGDLRPMKNRPSAMVELRALLERRAPLYARADVVVNTSVGLEAAVQSVCQVAAGASSGAHNA